MSRDNYPLNALSEALAKAVSLAGQSTVMVNARRRIPASGVAYKTNLIITADHAIERDADISIGTQNTDEHTATVLGRDPSSDLALLELEHNELMPGNFVLEPALVGQLSLALGRPSLNGIQASLGIVSAVGGLTRTRRGGLLEGYLRTDAIPYPGFSGGPLIDATGRILGVNTSGLTPGASITIPALLVRKVAAALEEHGSVPRGYLGIRSQQVKIPTAAINGLDSHQSTGLLIVSVEDGTPAAHAGLMVGDILVALNGERITDADQLMSRLLGFIAGIEMPIEIIRGGKIQTITITIGKRQ